MKFSDFVFTKVSVLENLKIPENEREGGPMALYPAIFCGTVKPNIYKCEFDLLKFN